MSRPRNADSAETYDRILNAALQIVRETGVTKLSMRAVAAGAGVSVGTVTYYFDDRDSLLEACLENAYRWIDQALSEALGTIAGAGGDMGDAIERVARQLFRHARANRELLRLRISTTMGQGALPKSRLDGELMPALGSVVAVLAPNASESVQRSLRMTAHTVEVVISRWAVHDQAELIAITGASNAQMAEGCAEDHVARLARRVLLELLATAG